MGTSDYGIHYQSPVQNSVKSIRDLSLPEAYLSSMSAKESAGMAVDASVDADYANSMDERRSTRKTCYLAVKESDFSSTFNYGS